MSSYSDSAASSNNSDSEVFDSSSPGPRRSQRTRTTTRYASLSYVESGGSDSGNEAGETANASEAVSEAIFIPEVETILGYKDNKVLVKFKGRSYLHLQWIPRDEFSNMGRHHKMRLSRFERDMAKRDQQDEERLYDPSCLEVDRVLSTMGLFPIIHPRQAAMVAMQWQGKCSAVLDLLMNFKKRDICYGVYFYDLVDDSDSDLTRYIVDLSTIHNRIYNGYYTKPREFWLDLGFVFKNCQADFTDPRSDMRVICDTLRQVAIHLYKQWHAQSEAEGLNPGLLSLRWVTTVPETDVLSSEFLLVDYDKIPACPNDEETDRKINVQHLSPDELLRIDLSSEVDKVYLVKWRNLSYADSTWESEKDLNCPMKIADFRRLNKALDPLARQQMTDLTNNFVKYMEQQMVQQESKKYKHFITQAKMTNIAPMLDFATHNFMQPVIQYPTSPKFKDNRELRDYQVQGLNWLLRNWHSRRNSILADEMGLGKTIQALSFFHVLITIYHLRGPYLVLAPLSTLAQWKKTAEDWTYMNVVVYHDPKGAEGREVCREYETYFTDIMKKGSTSKKSKLVKFHVLVTSFEVFKQDFESLFQQIPFQFIIIDEAHRLKNKDAKIIHMFKNIPCTRFTLLTGTPLQNNTEELWSLLHFIEPDHFASLTRFMTDFGNLATQAQVTQLQTQLKPYLLRRLKEEVEGSIPPLQETVIDVELTTLQKAYYRAIYEKNRSYLCRGASMPALNNMEIQLRKCCNHPFLVTGVEESLLRDDTNDKKRMEKLIECSGKMVLLDKLLPKLKADGKKILIFSQFTQMLNLIEEYLKFTKAKYERLDGSVKCMDRQAAIERFNSGTHLRDVFLLSTRAGGLGINLTSAQVVIIFDSDWNPQNDVQATARAHRIGQTQEVQVYRLVTARTYEAQMFERASRKLGLEQAVFSKEEQKEVEALLKFGAYSLLDEDASKSQQFAESNIEEILQKNSRVVNYSLIRGCYSLGKSSFVSQAADTSIDVNDPEFWSKVLPPQTTATARLYTKLNDQSFAVNPDTEGFLREVKTAVKDLLEQRLRTDTSEEEETMVSMLSQIQQTKAFSKKQHKKAKKWMTELNQPTRHSRHRAAKAVVLSDSDSDTLTVGKKGGYSSFKGTGLLCAVCYKEGCGWFCVGPCRRAFHSHCLKGEKDPEELQNEEREEETVLQRISQKWKCEDCAEMLGYCFVCKAKGSYRCRPEPYQCLIVKCSISTCGKSYHLACVHATGKRLLCPSHTCGICDSSDNQSSLLQCVECPNAFHKDCYSRKYTRLNKRFILCHNHKQTMEPVSYPVSERDKQQGKETARAIRRQLRQCSEDFMSLSLISDIQKNAKRPTGTHSPSPSKRIRISHKSEQQKTATEEQDWCRYCGARNVSLFAPGPWGARSLCAIHGAEWSQGAIDLSMYPNLPETPIDDSQNTEKYYEMPSRGSR